MSAEEKTATITNPDSVAAKASSGTGAPPHPEEEKNQMAPKKTAGSQKTQQSNVSQSGATSSTSKPVLDKSNQKEVMGGQEISDIRKPEMTAEPQEKLSPSAKKSLRILCVPATTQL